MRDEEKRTKLSQVSNCKELREHVTHLLLLYAQSLLLQKDQEVGRLVRGLVSLNPHPILDSMRVENSHVVGVGCR